MYGAAGMLVIAAAIEAFWSSAVWLPQEVKYGVAFLCWVAVLGYFLRQGGGSRQGIDDSRSGALAESSHEG